MTLQILLPYFYDAAIYYATILLLLQQAITLPYSYWYSKLLCYYTPTDTTILRYYTPIDTASNYVTIPLLIQQSITLLYPYWYSKLLRYYTPIDTASYYVTILLLIQQSNELLFSYWYSKPLCYYTTIDITIYMQQLKQQAMTWYIHEQGDHPPATGGPPPMRTPGAARKTPRQLSKTTNFVLFFSVLPFMLSISASPKTH